MDMGMHPEMNQRFDLSHEFDEEMVLELLKEAEDGIELTYVMVKEPKQVVVANGIGTRHRNVVSDYMQRHSLSGDPLDWGKNNLIDAGTVFFESAIDPVQKKSHLYCRTYNDSADFSELGRKNRSNALEEFRRVLMSLHGKEVDDSGLEFDFDLSDGTPGLSLKDSDWGPNSIRQ
jgi:hypothetical protein